MGPGLRTGKRRRVVDRFRPAEYEGGNEGVTSCARIAGDGTERGGFRRARAGLAKRGRVAVSLVKMMGDGFVQLMRSADG